MSTTATLLEFLSLAMRALFVDDERIVAAQREGRRRLVVRIIPGKVEVRGLVLASPQSVTDPGDVLADLVPEPPHQPSSLRAQLADDLHQLARLHDLVTVRLGEEEAAWTEGSMGRLSSMKPLQWRNSLLAYLKGRAVSASMRAAADMSFISSKMYSAQVFPLRTGFGIGSGSSSTVIEASCAWNSALRPEGFSSFWFFCFSRAATAARYSSQRFVSIST
eukprot:CAMPEP_0170185602 /NCGR_PEP_ID=MMETSP0040_2-20121228/36998_1 /TAXON_ID=641309 /ORGANISM="Lotharella oceanica, Strain CCMP622" /LENGTH=219 /DNA_ID=CAMNT_0010432057 /DNA_START=126 /DNA_END=784 /DNA_ORIENTATION=+